MWDWISALIIIYLLICRYVDNKRISDFERLIQRIEENTNSNTMSINYFDYWRSIETITPNPELDHDDLLTARKDLEYANSYLKTRNQFLNAQMALKK